MRFRAATVFAAFLVTAGFVTSWVLAQDSPSQTPSPEAQRLRTRSPEAEAARGESPEAVAARKKSAEGAKKNPSTTVRHVVLFEFKEDAPAEKVAEVEKAFVALADKIDEIADLEWGKNNSPEGLNKGYTHCFLVTFNSEEDLKAYLPHPEHQAFAKLLRPHLKEVMVIDYVPMPKGGEKEGEKEGARDEGRGASE